MVRAGHRAAALAGGALLLALGAAARSPARAAPAQRLRSRRLPSRRQPAQAAGGRAGRDAAQEELRIDDLPPGPHTLRVWHEKGAPIEERIEVVAGRTATREFRIDVSSFKEAPHTRKDGSAYGDDDEARY